MRGECVPRVSEDKKHKALSGSTWPGSEAFQTGPAVFTRPRGSSKRRCSTTAWVQTATPRFTSLSPDLVKLDMSLVRDIDRDPVKYRLVQGIMELCPDVGIIVVGEGVETPEERDAP